MSNNFSINVREAKNAADGFVSCRTKLIGLHQTILNVRSNMGLEGSYYNSVNSSLLKIADRTYTQCNDFTELSSSLRDIKNSYIKYDMKVSGETELSFFLDNVKGALWSAVGSVGAVGTAVKTIRTFVTSDDTGDKIFAGIKGVKSIADKVTKAIVAKQANISTAHNWKNALFGYGFDEAEKEAVKGVESKAATTSKWLKAAGYVVEFAEEGYENYKEHGGINARWAGETAIEAGVDIGIGAAASAGITAGLAAIGCTPVGWAAIGVTAAAAVIVVGANAGCKWLTKRYGGEEKDIGEWVSDGVMDTLEGKNQLGKDIREIGNEIAEGAKKVGSAIHNAADNIGTAWGSLVRAFA